MAVNKERVRLFVNALRSGQFKQGNGSLASHNSQTHQDEFCCLGVACEVARNNGLELSRAEYSSYGDGHGYVYGDKYGHGEQYFLPGRVIDWFGFNAENPKLILTEQDMQQAPNQDAAHASFANDASGGKLFDATRANDHYQLPFSVIADAFERTYLSAENHDSAE